MKHLYFLMFILIFGVATKLLAIPAQVIIVRHAEKDFIGDLNRQGFERAAALAPYFTQTSDLTQFGLPAAIFGARQTNNGTDTALRIIQTALPTSQFLGLPIHLGFSQLQSTEIADFILSNPDFDGKNILIVWHSEGIPCLIRAFGFLAPAAQLDRYDITFVLPLPSPSPTQEVVRYAQELLFGDSSTLPPYGTYPFSCPITLN